MKKSRGFLTAVSFLTRIPVRHRKEPEMGAAAPWFPVVGLLIGFVVGIITKTIGDLTSPLLGASCGVVTGILITGAFHEDGLADVADAFVGGWTPDERLKILKDPRHGTYGVVALVGSILVRTLALGSIPSGSVIIASVTAHGISRASALSLMLGSKPARSSGLGADYVRKIRPVAGWTSVLLSLVLTTLLVGYRSTTFITLASIALTLMINLWARSKISGVSGDVLGTTQQINEIAVFLILAVITNH